jgi:hypothetical protein
MKICCPESTYSKSLMPRACDVEKSITRHAGSYRLLTMTVSYRHCTQSSSIIPAAHSIPRIPPSVGLISL